MWQEQAKLPMHYFGSFLIQTIKKEHLLLYSTTFQDNYLPQLHKNMKHFTNEIQSGWTPLSILKKANLRYDAIMDKAKELV